MIFCSQVCVSSSGNVNLSLLWKRQSKYIQHIRIPGFTNLPSPFILG